jgi:hypothetical protein
LALCCIWGVFYPLQKNTAFTANGGYKPRHYFISRLNQVSYKDPET